MFNKLVEVDGVIYHTKDNGDLVKLDFNPYTNNDIAQKSTEQIAESLIEAFKVYVEFAKKGEQ